MDEVSKELIPFCVTWAGKQPFHKPNSTQDSACQKLVSIRLVDEAFYEFAKNNDPSNISDDPEEQNKQADEIAKSLADAALGVVQRETHVK